MVQAGLAREAMSVVQLGSPLRILPATGMITILTVALCGWPSRGYTQPTSRQSFARPREVPFPAGNPYSKAKEQLGRILFLEPRLSKSGTRACATCHDPRKEFSDGVALPVDAEGRLAKRHTPTLWNLAWNSSFFWDGRAATLEEQIKEPIVTELGLSLDELTRRVAADPNLVSRFADAFEDQKVSITNISSAIATYLRTLVSPRNRFDVWVEGNDTALSPEEQRGFDLFVGKANCVRCHSGWNFTDQRLHDTGIADDDDLGGRTFKTPTLRGIRWSQPFMHNGRIAKLRYVVEHYEHNFVPRPALSREIVAFTLTETERNDLVSFLRAIGDGESGGGRLPITTLRPEGAPGEGP
jgi:cytochrome c peroxidase